MWEMLLERLFWLRLKVTKKLMGSTPRTSEVLAFLSSTSRHEAREFEQYDLRSPSRQNVIDILPGWVSAFPSEVDLKAGSVPLFADDRIFKALEVFGSIEDKAILEVGPLEGMHTYILNQSKPARIDAVEANKISYLRCLISKNILNLDRAHFHLGDVQHWLRETETRYDLAIASGVLYHMQDPALFLSRLADHCNAVFIWTHFYDERAMSPDDVRLHSFSGNVEKRIIDGLELNYYERSYFNSNSNASFCGGVNNKHFWIGKNDILMLLEHFGFDEIVELGTDMDHQGGPSFSVFARKKKATSPEA